MSGNTFGTLFRITTFGESHGPGIGCVVDGCPPGLFLTEADIQPDLNRRRPGQSRFTSQRREPDKVTILSGVFENKTTGTPIGLWIENQGARAKDYEGLRYIFRPGHADFTYFLKYGIRDHRGGGRSSARVTAACVAAGAIAKKCLCERYGVIIRGAVIQMGSIKAQAENWDSVERNPFFFLDSSKVQELKTTITALRKGGDSIGAKVIIRADGVPPGWGEPVFDRLDSELAFALMGINAVKGVEIGDGFSVVEERGSFHRDELTPSGFLSNHAGGILGGISTGQPVVAKIALKPTSSIRVPGRTVTTENRIASVVTTGRHDPCVGIRAVSIAEAMMALVLMDQALRQQATDFHFSNPPSRL